METPRPRDPLIPVLVFFRLEGCLPINLKDRVHMSQQQQQQQYCYNNKKNRNKDNNRNAEIIFTYLMRTSLSFLQATGNYRSASGEVNTCKYKECQNKTGHVG